MKFLMSLVILLLQSIKDILQKNKYHLNNIIDI